MTASPAGLTQVASQRIANALRESILAGEVLPGQRIRQEDVAERLGASRLPVREALRMLEAEGLVEHEPNRGARVPLHGPREIDLMYQMRERLEPLALTESTPHLTCADLDRLEGLQEQIADLMDVGEFLRLDREFHLLTYSHCGMEPLSSTVLRLWNSTQHYRRLFMDLIGPSQRWVVNAEHDLLLEALRRQDSEDAARCLGGHIRRTRVELSRHPEVFGPPS